MSTAGSWPRWSLEGEPAALAKYVLPDQVAALISLPGPPADSRLGQARAVYEALAGASITYSHEAPSDDPGRQVIRQPGEILWCPKHATCLDLALILAGACLHAGLHPLVLVLDAPEPGRAAHALLGVWIDDPDDSDDSDGIRVPDADVWASRPDGFSDLVQTDPTGPSRPLLLLDPVGVAHALPSSPILGTSAAFADAARAGARYSREWNWRLGVDIRRAWRERDTHTPADRPDDQPLRPPYLALDPLVHRPLQVLRAEHAVVPFQARDELTILTDWCHTVAAGPYTGITVVHGAGGAGKTRLALELAHQLATRDGWYTGYLREHTTGRDWLGTVVSPTLIVLDYADARTADAEQLLAILKRRMERGAAPTVVIMTARAVNGQWLTTLRKVWNRDGHLVREGAPLHLPPEHPAGATLFRRAARAFHHGPDTDLDLDAADRAAPTNWTTLDYILLALLAARSPGRLPTTREDLYEEVLTHERTYWAQTYKKNASLGRDADAPLDILNRAVASLTLRAPTTRKQIHAALRAVEELSGDAQWRETIRTTLTTCLQPGPGEPLVLRPDPIADHLTLHQLHDDEDLLPSILDGLDGDRLLAALRQLNRAATAAPDSATDMVNAWVSTGTDRWQPLLHIAAEQGGTALAALQRLVDNDPAVPWLGELSDAIPFTPIGLPELGLHADLRHLSTLRADATTQPAELADQLQRTSHRQFAAGDRQAALTSITEAVEIYRALAQASPAAYLPDLAMSLNNLSVRQSERGDRQAALASITEAVEIYRALAQASPAAYLPDLAMSVNNLSVRQSERGDRQAALASITEAVEIRRALAQASPAAYLPDLAGSLNNLSNQQSQTGVACSAWEDAITDLKCNSLAQAELRAHYAAYLAVHADAGLAIEQLVQAALACAVGDPSPLSRARQQVRGTATSLDIQDPRLPDWAVGRLPDDVLELLNQWAQAAGWPTTEAFLSAHADRLQQSDLRHHLELAAALFPENPAVDNLTGVLGQVDTEGLDTVLDRGRHDYEVRQLLHEWIATPTWRESKDFLDEHGSKLPTPEIQELLAGTDAPAARQHLAILQFTETLSHDQVYEIVTDRDVATEHASTAVDQADVPSLHRVLAARPDLLDGITGAFFATVSAAAGGDADQARQHAQTIAEHGTDTQRRAYAIRLRTLARLAPALGDAEELADLIHPDEHS